MRCALPQSRGVAPVICLKTRWKWKRLMPAASASSARLGSAVAGADQGAGPADRRDMPLGQRALARPAALARPEAGRLGGVGGLVERDVLPPRLARGAARPAIHPGGAHRIEEAAVLRRVMRRSTAAQHCSSFNMASLRYQTWCQSGAAARSPLPEPCFLIRARSHQLPRRRRPPSVQPHDGRPRSPAAAA